MKEWLYLSKVDGENRFFKNKEALQKIHEKQIQKDIRTFDDKCLRLTMMQLDRFKSQDMLDGDKISDPREKLAVGREVEQSRLEELQLLLEITSWK